MASETAVGMKGWVVGVKEVTWGVNPGGTPRRIPFVSESLKAAIGVVEDESIRSDRGNDTPAQGNINPAGDINVVWSADAHGWLFWACIAGAVTVTGTSPYLHSFSEYINPDLPSYTLERGFTDVNQYFVVTGCRMNQVTFTVQPEQTVKGAVSVIGMNEIASGTPINAAPTSITRRPLDSFSGSLNEFSIVLANATEATIRIMNNLGGVNVLFSQFKGALLAARLKISGTLTAFFTNLTLYNRFRNFTESNVIMKMQDANGRYIQIHVPHVRYTAGPPNISGEGPLFIPMEYNAYTDTVSNNQLLCQVSNMQATINT